MAVNKLLEPENVIKLGDGGTNMTDCPNCNRKLDSEERGVMLLYKFKKCISCRRQIEKMQSLRKRDGSKV